jgi:hypothetical protein
MQILKGERGCNYVKKSVSRIYNTCAVTNNMPQTEALIFAYKQKPVDCI